MSLFKKPFQKGHLWPFFIYRMHFPCVVKSQFLAAIIFNVFLVHVTSLSFNFPIFKQEDENQLILSDFSRVFREAIQVTPDARGEDLRNKSGRAFYNIPYKLYSEKKNQTASFNTTFVLRISPQPPLGAGEGLAFILTADTDLPPNSDGQWLGIVNSTTNGTSQAKIFAVEFDTRKSFPEDGPDNHVGINLNSIYSIQQKPLIPLGINISSSTDVTVRIRYADDVISVFGYVMNDGTSEKHMQTLLVSPPLNLSSYLPEKVFLGFSGSTGDYTELNCIRAWEFNGIDIEDNQNLPWVWIIVPTVIIVVGLLFLLLWQRKRRMEIPEDAYPRIEDQIQGSSMAPKKFQLREIRGATGNFNPQNKLGEGGFGKVYKGCLGNKQIAVKRVSKNSRQGKQEFIAEVTTIGSLHHKNLVKLIGWCYEKQELLIVYEFMPNRSLDKHLFGDNKLGCKEGSTSTLSWETRQSVVHGVAQALDYLHNGCEKKVLHRDIKASNIMLDYDFTPKLGDFGLARTIQKRNETHHSTKEIAGTPGYMAPETFLIGRATVETDVYAFGILVLEVICGKRPGNLDAQNDYKNSIAYWVWELYGKGRILAAVDERISTEETKEKEVENVLVLGLACCHPNPHRRPSMRTVLQVLTGEVPPPVVAKERPAFVWPAMPPSFKEDADNSLAGNQPTLFTELTGR